VGEVVELAKNTAGLTSSLHDLAALIINIRYLCCCTIKLGSASGQQPPCTCSTTAHPTSHSAVNGADVCRCLALVLADYSAAAGATSFLAFLLAAGFFLGAAAFLGVAFLGLGAAAATGAAINQTDPSAHAA